MTQTLAELDFQYCWHPFSSSDVPAKDRLVIVKGKGEWLWDDQGRRYLDGNSSIWCNIHGHNHPALNRALVEQVKKVAHSSYLGLANEPASILAQKLVNVLHSKTNLGFPRGISRAHLPRRVFYSDNGSCANEIAAKMAVQFFRITGQAQRKILVSFDNAYHGDTMLNVSLGGVSVFSEPYKDLRIKTHRVRDLADLKKLLAQKGNQVAAVFLESALAGAGGMIPHPPGFMEHVSASVRKAGALLVVDEVLAGFARTGPFLGCYREKVTPDFITLSKGLTAGYLPLAITLAPERVYQVFKGDYYSGRLFYHGHTYTANPLACRVGLENLVLFETTDVMTRVKTLSEEFAWELSKLSTMTGLETGALGMIGYIRVPHHRTKGDQARTECLKLRAKGVLTRPIGNTIVLMPPYCISSKNIRTLVQAIER